MRYSAIATMLMLATLMLSMSACSKSTPAQVVDNRSKTYTRGTMPIYSDTLRATQSQDVAYKYKSDVQTYGAEAEVMDVTTSETLPPPKAQPQAPLAAKPASAAAQNPATTPFAKPAASKATPAIKPLPVVGGRQFIWPLRGNVISRFGLQPDGSMQEGIVIDARRGAPILAAAAGEVVYVGAALADYGQMIILRHTGGYMTSYAHAEEITAKKGSKVQQGDLIAYAGKSGNAPTPRLHFTIRAGKDTVDPMPFLATSGR